MIIRSTRIVQFLAVAALGVATASVNCFGGEPQKKPEVAPAEANPGIELSPESAHFVEIAPAGAQTNQIWGRRIPARVALQTAAHVSVGAVVEGRVELVLVRPGDFVKTGDPLLKVHSLGGGAARAEAQQAQARLEVAEETLRRYTNMVAKGIATELELFEAQSHAREARIDAERTRTANTMLGDGNGLQFYITAPTNGVVLSISAITGAALQPGNDVIELGDPSKVWIEAEVSDDDTTQMSRGQEAMLELPHSTKTLNASVETIGVQVDPITRRRKIYLTPEADVKALTPGMLVTARLSQPRDQIMLPVEAVLIKDGEHRIVYVQCPDGKLRSRDVVVNTPFEGRVRVLQGLTPGERVVVKGTLLVDGRSEQLL